MTAASPTGPKGHPITGNLREFRRDPLDFLTRCQRTYGDFVPIRLGPVRAVLLCDPQAIDEVLSATGRRFTRHYLLRLSGTLLGRGLFTSDGELWQRERRLIQPAFHRQEVASFADVMVKNAEQHVERLHDGEERHLHADMMRVTLENVARTLFDADVSGDADEVGTALKVVMDNFLARLEMALPPPEWLPTPRNRRLRRAIRQLDTIIHRLIAEHRDGGFDRGDMLSMLLRIQAADPAVMTDRQIRDESMSLFTGGHEPVAAGLSWIWYLLAQHPEVEAELCRELDQVLHGRPPAAGDLANLRYTEMVVKESMRLYPPAWAFDRKATADCEVAGRPVKAGTLIFMVQWVLHRDPRFFPDPEEFRPARWSDGGLGLPKYAYFPFGGGPRFCIGNSFAMMQTVLVVATMLQRVSFRLVEGQQVEPQPTITLRPRNGLRMRVVRR